MIEFLVGAGVIYFFCCRKKPKSNFNHRHFPFYSTLPNQSYEQQKIKPLLEMALFSSLKNKSWKEIYLEEAKRAAYLGIGDLTGEKK